MAKELRKDFENIKIDKKLDDHREILKLIADKMAIQLLKYEKDLSLMGNAKTSTIVVSGVNGVGKTTSIGKLGKYFKDNNRSVVFGAADTLRTARLAFVDFDGTEAIRGIMTQNQTVDDAFLKTYCPNMVNGVNRLIEWLK